MSDKGSSNPLVRNIASQVMRGYFVTPDSIFFFFFFQSFCRFQVENDFPIK